MLEPKRSQSNIRYYDISNLQKLLNVSLLNNNGLKISKIADLTDTQISVKVREIIAKKGVKSQASNSFKLAMLNFDENLFNVAYNNLVATSTFRDIFKNVFLPLMGEIGLLWQVNSITPAQEHFITNLIKQKIHLNIERLQLSQPTNLKKIFVLYLPLNEIHELGLLYLHFELLLHGYQSLYLGQSVPVANLLDVQKVYNTTCFVTYLTVEPSKISVQEYIDKVHNEILMDSNSELWVVGRKIADSPNLVVDEKYIKLYASMVDILKYL